MKRLHLGILYALAVLAASVAAMADQCSGTNPDCPWESKTPLVKEGSDCGTPSSNTWRSIKTRPYDQDCCDGSHSSCQKFYPVFNSKALRTYNMKDETFQCGTNGSLCVVTTKTGGPDQTSECCN